MKGKILGIAIALALVATVGPLAIVSAQTGGALDHVLIVPASATVVAGGTQQFTATGQDAENNAIEGVTYTWAVVAGGGTISNEGLFAAGTATGTFTNTIQVTAVKGDITRIAYATVTVSSAPSPVEPKVPPGWSQGKKNGWNGGDTPPGWSKGKKTGWDGQSIPPGLLKGAKAEPEEFQDSTQA